MLALIRNCLFNEFAFQSFLIHWLQKPVSRFAMHPHGGADYCMSLPIPLFICVHL